MSECARRIILEVSLLVPTTRRNCIETMVFGDVGGRGYADGGTAQHAVDVGGTATRFSRARPKFNA